MQYTRKTCQLYNKIGYCNNKITDRCAIINKNTLQVYCTKYLKLMYKAFWSKFAKNSII